MVGDRWRRSPRWTRRRRSAPPSSSRWTTSSCARSCPSRRPWRIPRCASTSTATRPNVHKAVALEFGDVEAGFAEADLVREDAFFFEGNTHLPMEQHAAVAQCGPDGKLTLWSSTQTPHYVHRALAKVLEMPQAHIRVIAAPVGGGFGGKSDPFGHEIVVCKLSKLTGRPVKITLTREEVFYGHRGRHPVRMWVKTGFKKDGAHHRHALPLLARRRRLRLLRRGQHLLHGRAADRHLQDSRATSSRAPASSPTSRPAAPSAGTARRSPASPWSATSTRLPSSWASIRRTCGGATSPSPFTKTANQMNVTTIGLGECLERVVEASGWRREGGQPAARARASASRARPTSPARAPPSTGTPCRTRACWSGSTGAAAWPCSAAPPTSARARTPSWPTWWRRCSASRPRTSACVTADTDLTPVDLGSYSSRVTLMAGNAAIQAARTAARAHLRRGGAQARGAEPERLAAAGRPRLRARTTRSAA